MAMETLINIAINMNLYSSYDESPQYRWVKDSIDDDTVSYNVM